MLLLGKLSLAASSGSCTTGGSAAYCVRLYSGLGIGRSQSSAAVSPCAFGALRRGASISQSSSLMRDASHETRGDRDCVSASCTLYDLDYNVLYCNLGGCRHGSPPLCVGNNLYVAKTFE